MSADFRTASKLMMSDLFDGRLSKYGIREDRNDCTFRFARFLTDNENVILVYGNPTGRVSLITGDGMNSCQHILSAIAQEFDTEIYTEEQPQFWGCSSQEEFEEWMLHPKRFPDDFFESVIQYLSGNGVAYEEGTFQRIQLEIAKELSDQDAELLLPENRDRLLEEIGKTDVERYMDTMKRTELESARMIKSLLDYLSKEGIKLPVANQFGECESFEAEIARLK